MSSSPDSSPSQPSLIREVGARKWSVAAVAALAVASGIYFSLRLPPTYAAEARVLVTPIDPAGDATFAPSPNMATELEIALSTELARTVRDRLGLHIPASELMEGLSIDNPIGTELLILTFTDRDPAFARQATEAYAEEYVRLRRRGAVQARLESVRETQDRIAALSAELERMDKRIRVESNETVVTSLISRVALLTSLLVRERQELRSFQTQPDVAEVFQPAVSLGRVGPSYPRNALLALLLGLTLGVAQAAVRGRLDDKLRSVEEAEPYLRSSALALIPSIRGLDRRRSGFSGVPASISDAFVPLRVSFVAAASRREGTVFVVTSASPGEGRSTITTNLAISLALSGRRVTVICADPERHRLERSFGASAEIGLAQVLHGSVPLGQALLPNIVRNLTLLPCGRPTGGGFELSQAMATQVFFDWIRQRSGFVLLDSPPIGHSEALSLLPFADGVMFIVDSRRMHGRKLAIARRQLDRADADLLGIVFNRASRAVIRPDPRLLAAAGSLGR